MGWTLHEYDAQPAAFVEHVDAMIFEEWKDRARRNKKAGG